MRARGSTVSQEDTALQYTTKVAGCVISLGMSLCPVIVCFCFLVNFACAQESYDELVKMAEFPRPLLEPEEGKPVGNNLPFGMQRPADGPIKEYQEPLSANDFWRLHVKDHVPLVYRGIIKNSSALLNWKDEYLAEKYGDLDVLVEHKVEDRKSTSGRMKIRDFLKFYKSDDLYVVSMFPREMMHEVKAVASIMCGTFKNYALESNLWISNGGTRSVIHYDADHNIHCMLAGRKDFIMVPNNVTTKRNLYFKRKRPTSGSGFTYLNPDSINMEKFPNVSKVPWTWATLFPGDCIFIPSVYIHQVRSYGRSIAVTSLFTADVKGEFSGDDCTEDVLKKDWTMADIGFQWWYEKGSKTIDMGYMDVQVVRTRMLERIASLEKKKNLAGMRFGHFLAFSGNFSIGGRNKTRMREIWRDVFGFGKTFTLTAAGVGRLSVDQLKTYCRAIEDAHGIVTDGYEEVFLRPGQGERYRFEEQRPDLNPDSHAFLTDEEKKMFAVIDQDPYEQYTKDTVRDGVDPESLADLKEKIRRGEVDAADTQRVQQSPPNDYGDEDIVRDDDDNEDGDDDEDGGDGEDGDDKDDVDDDVYYNKKTSKQYDPVDNGRETDGSIDSDGANTLLEKLEARMVKDDSSETIVDADEAAHIDGRTSTAKKEEL